ncbi:MAG: DbpA RNA binding domain-containing protein [Thermoleophilaceae bacterium]
MAAAAAEARGETAPAEVATPEAAPAVPAPDDDPPQPRRPRHTKPHPERNGRRTTLIIGAGRLQGLEPADVVGAIVDRSRLKGEEVTGVRILERFALASVPSARAEEVVERLRGHDVRGVPLLLEVARP